VEDTAIEGFRLVSEKELKYTVNLDTGEDIRALFMMTPYAYRTNAQGRERVLSLEKLVTEAHFHILTYERQ
jgi:23S rRNA (guanine745-N1)-methyltransferase